MYDTVFDEDNTCNDDQIITASTLFRKAKGKVVLHIDVLDSQGSG